MKIRNQSWIETDEFIAITLLEPYWSAWKKYGWLEGVEGFGISKEAINYAVENKKRIRVHINKYGTYEVGYLKAKKEATSDRLFFSRDKGAIYVLPRFAFDSVTTFDKDAYDKKEHERAIKNSEQLHITGSEGRG
jgi:hypothetical protein